ncbi:hypothetical protein FA13DRAFT_1791499 [Coprinellus micaceus]|uniref:NACHT domain-containing protein n=1 Tax=Coprinellus micaceus TaxID=71717 RepID=A0A4Y7TCB0_COPMI|nr:hypothetical protein FA13DRAFT_1791499 [Coprinellus micaceus]
MPGFSGSHIQEANFTSVGGSYSDHRRVRIQNYNIGPESDPRRDTENRHFLDELAKRSAPGAIANAEERAYAPRCLHETRTRVLNDLGEWSAAEGRWKDAKLLVLTGPAGHGKTAIIQSFSEKLLQQSRETRVVVATFFFKATISDQNQPKALVTTLAYQVAEHWPSFRDNIGRVIRDNVRIFSTSLEHQMEHLLTSPIVRLQASPPSPPFIVICAVDGLDECAGVDAQSRVIRLLHILSKIPNTRILLASRPEFPIQSALQGGLSETLHIDLNKVYDASKDIRQFTWIRLLEIRDRLLPKLDRVSWPREEDAEQIANYSSGQFILADTAMRYIDDQHYDPRERLKEVLALCGGANSSFAMRRVAVGRGPARPLGVLDALFTEILERAARNTYPDLEPEQGVLELASLVWILIRLVPSRIDAVTSHVFLEYVPLWVIEEALGRQSGDLARELSDLHSLLDVPQDMCGRNEISAHHKSFLDFLGDPGRSGHLGNIPEVAQGRFDLMIKAHLSSLTVNDLKSLVLTQPVKPHILHSLHLLSNPETVIKGIDPQVWKSLLCSLNAWEALRVKQWVHVGLSQGPLLWDFEDSKTLRMMDEASKRSLDDLLPRLGNQGPLDPPPISDMDIKLLLATLDGQGDESFKCGHSEFIPKQRMGPYSPVVLSSFPWFPAARALAWLWVPSHRLITDQSRVTQPTGTPNSHPLEPSHIVFITGSAGSGKRELLEEAYKLLPAGREGGPPEGWMPPVDIIIVPDTDGVSLRSLWTPGAFGEELGGVPCDNKDLMGKINLLEQFPAPLFQDWIACWETKHEKNTYHPQFLLQGLHLLAPEHQAALLDIISSHAGQSDSTGRSPLFITVTSLPTATFASRLGPLPWPGVYYVNLDGMKADVSILEGVLPFQTHTVPQLKIHKLARILAASPKPARHLKRLINHQRYNWEGWEDRLDPILAAPESEAWRLIEEHFGEIPSDDGGR